jgi:plasmid stabilization system protein ParE
MAKVIWTDAAIADLGSVFDYLASSSQSADRAEQFCLDLLDRATQRLERHPDTGALVAELTEWSAREIYRNSYRIIYVHRGDACYVNMCIHSSRDLARHLDRKRWDILP